MESRPSAESVRTLLDANDDPIVAVHNRRQT
jgi:hypothetical protein